MNALNLAALEEDALPRDSAIVDVRLVDADTLMLVYFDLDELALLTPGELRLLRAVAGEMLPFSRDPGANSDVTREYRRRLRETLIRPRSKRLVEQDPATR